MSAPLRVLRLKTVTSDTCAMPHGRPLLDVTIDGASAPVGQIVWFESAAAKPARWEYILSNGLASGLDSTFSRQDLETRILERYFQELVDAPRQSA